MYTRPALLAAIPLLLLARVAGAADESKPFAEAIEFRPKLPTEKISLSLVDADLDEAVKTIGEITGKRFLVATGKAKSFKTTIYAPPQITVAEAYQAFLSALHANGLTVLPAGSLLKIVDSQDAARLTTPVVGQGAATLEERYVTQLVRLEHAGAEDIAQVLGKFQSHDGSAIPYAPGNLLILTDTGANLARLTAILREIDVAGTTHKLYIEPIHNVSSADLAKKLDALLDLKRSGLEIAKLESFERPNALAIVATDAAYHRLLDVIRRIDEAPPQDGGAGQINVLPLAYTDAKKIAAALNGVTGAAAAKPGPAATASPGGMPALEGAVSVSAEETTNSLIVTASPRDFSQIRDVVLKLDQPKRQVYIEAIVMDVSVDNMSALGVAWHGGDIAGGNNLLYGGLNPMQSIMPDPTTMQGLALGVRGPTIPTGLDSKTGLSEIPSLGAMVTAVATTSGTDVLSTPHVLASDNTPAEIHVELNTSLQPHAPQLPVYPNATPFSPLMTQGVGANYQKIGPKIVVTPHLGASDEVRLDVEETIRDVASAPNPNDTYGTLSFLERYAKTTLTVKDEETVVIGGLVRNRVARTETKVPLLGDIPVLGALFRSTRNESQKSNLVLVLTPHVIHDTSDMRRIYETKMAERQSMINHALVFETAGYTPPKNYGAAHGLLGAMRASARSVDEERRLAERRPARPSATHDPQDPMELPVPVQTWGTPAKSAAPPSSPPATPVNGSVRVER